MLQDNLRAWHELLHEVHVEEALGSPTRTAGRGSARRTPQQQQQRRSPARTPSTYHTPATGNGYTPSTPLEGWYSIMSALSATPAASRTGASPYRRPSPGSHSSPNSTRRVLLPSASRWPTSPAATRTSTRQHTSGSPSGVDGWYSPGRVSTHSSLAPSSTGRRGAAADGVHLGSSGPRSRLGSSGLEPVGMRSLSPAAGSPGYVSNSQVHMGSAHDYFSPVSPGHSSISFRARSAATPHVMSPAASSARHSPYSSSCSKLAGLGTAGRSLATGSSSRRPASAVRQKGPLTDAGTRLGGHGRSPNRSYKSPGSGGAVSASGGMHPGGSNSSSRGQHSRSPAARQRRQWEKLDLEGRVAALQATTDEHRAVMERRQQQQQQQDQPGAQQQWQGPGAQSPLQSAWQALQAAASPGGRTLGHLGGRAHEASRLSGSPGRREAGSTGMGHVAASPLRSAASPSSSSYMAHMYTARPTNSPAAARWTASPARHAASAAVAGPAASGHPQPMLPRRLFDTPALQVHQQHTLTSAVMLASGPAASHEQHTNPSSTTAPPQQRMPATDIPLSSAAAPSPLANLLPAQQQALSELLAVLSSHVSPAADGRGASCSEDVTAATAAMAANLTPLLQRLIGSFGGSSRDGSGSSDGHDDVSCSSASADTTAAAAATGAGAQPSMELHQKEVAVAAVATGASSASSKDSELDATTASMTINANQLDVAHVDGPSAAAQPSAHIQQHTERSPGHPLQQRQFLTMGHGQRQAAPADVAPRRALSFGSASTSSSTAGSPVLMSGDRQSLAPTPCMQRWRQGSKAVQGTAAAEAEPLLQPERHNGMNGLPSHAMGPAVGSPSVAAASSTVSPDRKLARQHLSMPHLGNKQQAQLPSLEAGGRQLQHALSEGTGLSGLANAAPVAAAQTAASPSPPPIATAMAPAQQPGPRSPPSLPQTPTQAADAGSSTPPPALFSVRTPGGDAAPAATPVLANSSAALLQLSEAWRGEAESAQSRFQELLQQWEEGPGGAADGASPTAASAAAAAAAGEAAFHGLMAAPISQQHTAVPMSGHPSSSPAATVRQSATAAAAVANTTPALGAALREYSAAVAALPASHTAAGAAAAAAAAELGAALSPQQHTTMLTLQPATHTLGPSNSELSLSGGMGPMAGRLLTAHTMPRQWGHTPSSLTASKAGMHVSTSPPAIGRQSPLVVAAAASAALRAHQDRPMGSIARQAAATLQQLQMRLAALSSSPLLAGEQQQQWLQPPMDASMHGAQRVGVQQQTESGGRPRALTPGSVAKRRLDLDTPASPTLRAALQQSCILNSGIPQQASHLGSASQQQQQQTRSHSPQHHHHPPLQRSSAALLESWQHSRAAARDAIATAAASTPLSRILARATTPTLSQLQLAAEGGRRSPSSSPERRRLTFLSALGSEAQSNTDALAASGVGIESAQALDSSFGTAYGGAAAVRGPRHATWLDNTTLQGLPAALRGQADALSRLRRQQALLVRKPQAASGSAAASAGANGVAVDSGGRRSMSVPGARERLRLASWRETGHTSSTAGNVSRPTTPWLGDGSEGRWLTGRPLSPSPLAAKRSMGTAHTALRTTLVKEAGAETISDRRALSAPAVRATAASASSSHSVYSGRPPAVAVPLSALRTPGSGRLQAIAAELAGMSENLATDRRHRMQGVSASAARSPLLAASPLASGSALSVGRQQHTVARADAGAALGSLRQRLQQHAQRHGLGQQASKGQSGNGVLVSPTLWQGARPPGVRR